MPKKSKYRDPHQKGKPAEIKKNAELQGQLEQHELQLEKMMWRGKLEHRLQYDPLSLFDGDIDYYSLIWSLAYIQENLKTNPSGKVSVFCICMVILCNITKTLANTTDNTLTNETLLYQTTTQTAIIYEPLNFNSNGRLDLSNFDLSKKMDQLEISYNSARNITSIKINVSDSQTKYYQLPGTKTLSKRHFIFDKPKKIDLDWSITEYEGGDNDDVIVKTNQGKTNLTDIALNKKGVKLNGGDGDDILKAPHSIDMDLLRKAKHHNPRRGSSPYGLPSTVSNLRNVLEGGPGADQLYGGKDSIDWFVVDNDPKNTDVFYKFEPVERNHDHDAIDISSQNITDLAEIEVNPIGKDLLLRFPSGQQVIIKDINFEDFCRHGNKYFERYKQHLDCSKHFKLNVKNFDQHLILRMVTPPIITLPTPVIIDSNYSEISLEISHPQAGSYAYTAGKPKEVNKYLNDWRFFANKPFIFYINAINHGVEGKFSVNHFVEQKIVYPDQNFSLSLNSEFFHAINTSDFIFNVQDGAWPAWLKILQEQNLISLYGVPTIQNLGNLTLQFRIKFNGRGVAEYIELVVKEKDPLFNTPTRILLYLLALSALSMVMAKTNKLYNKKKYIKTADKILIQKSRTFTPGETVAAQAITNEILERFYKIEPILVEKYSFSFFKKYIGAAFKANFTQKNIELITEKIVSLLNDYKHEQFAATIDKDKEYKGKESAEQEIFRQEHINRLSSISNEHRTLLIIKTTFILIAEFKCGITQYPAIVNMLLESNTVASIRNSLSSHPKVLKKILFALIKNCNEKIIEKYLTSLTLDSDKRTDILASILEFNNYRTHYKTDEDVARLRLGSLSKNQYDQAIGLFLQQTICEIEENVAEPESELKKTV